MSTAHICLAAIGSMTTAIKAQRTLLQAGITAQVHTLSPAQTRNGCAYGVGFPCAQLGAARQALRAAHIPVTQYINAEDTPP